ncbi:MAG TPA: NAD(P)-binding protein, partial [Longimicrobiales bacterium]|nr:NAD(P)-binding protein [Longimicrobiales bacterium]
MSGVAGARPDGRYGPEARNASHGRDRGRRRHRQVVVVGSGFGGALAAWPLVEEGVDVLMLERGPWVSRGAHNWAPEGTLTRTPYYDGSRYRARTDAGPGETGSTSCVGGPSVFYGGVSFRFREEDFRPDPELAGDSGSEWPLGYGDLEPHYAEAERILAVTGRGGEDPTEPPRSGGYPAPPDDLSHVSGV